MDPSTLLFDHGDALFAYAFKRVRERSVAEDLVQETLVAALVDPEAFEGRSALRTWLFGILRHKLIDHWRAKARAPRSLDGSDDKGILSGTWSAHVDSMFAPDGHWSKERAPRRWSRSAAERDEAGTALRDCLEKLPPRAAETFLLREQHGVSVERLSQDLGTTTMNVWQILSRARATLRECLERSGAVS